MRLWLERNVSSVKVGHAIPDGLHQLRFSGTFVQDGQEKKFWATCFVFENKGKIKGTHVVDVWEQKSGDDFFLADVTWVDKNVFAEAIIYYLAEEGRDIFGKESENGSKAFSNL